VLVDGARDAIDLRFRRLAVELDRLCAQSLRFETVEDPIFDQIEDDLVGQQNALASERVDVKCRSRRRLRGLGRTTLAI